MPFFLLFCTYWSLLHGLSCKILSLFLISTVHVRIFLDFWKRLEYLKLNKHNIVVHASDLPAGKGFSPLQWQILEGKNEIILTLFEAVKEVDAGPFYIKRKLLIESTDLLYESRKKMGNLIVNMCIEYIEQGENIKPIKQIGEESFYRKRKREDDEIDINKTIKEQFNHFRIADNEKFSLYFEYLGEKYILKIYKESADDWTSSTN